MDSYYIEVGGREESRKIKSNFSTFLCTFGATVVVSLLVASATKTINNVSNHMSTQHGTQPAVRAIAVQRLQLGPLRHTETLRPNAMRQSEAQETSQTSAMPFGQHYVNLIGASCLSLAVLFGFSRRSPRHHPISMMAISGARPTLADTKLKFLELADASIPNMYNIPLQELLAQHHLIRFSSKYQYDELFALGMVTVINQLLEGRPQEESDRIQNAYFASLGDNMEQFKADAAELEKWAASKGKELGLSSSDDAVTQKLKAVAARAASGDFQYSKFFSIGLFQLLQQSGQTDPEHFTNLVKDMSLDKERVTKDLKVYKDLLKRLEMAKDMKEKFLERERKKQQERMAQKTQSAA